MDGFEFRVQNYHTEVKTRHFGPLVLSGKLVGVKGVISDIRAGWEGDPGMKAYVQ